ncbi:hypothetical protein M432DRAFT_591353 [Thermoascus aurantiacus ATCC 26904]
MTPSVKLSSTYTSVRLSTIIVLRTNNNHTYCFKLHSGSSFLMSRTEATHPFHEISKMNRQIVRLLPRRTALLPVSLARRSGIGMAMLRIHKENTTKIHSLEGKTTSILSNLELQGAMLGNLDRDLQSMETRLVSDLKSMETRSISHIELMKSNLECMEMRLMSNLKCMEVRLMSKFNTELHSLKHRIASDLLWIERWMMLGVLKGKAN